MNEENTQSQGQKEQNEEITKDIRRVTTNTPAFIVVVVVVSLVFV